MLESYRDLKVWQRAIEMTLSIYRVTTGFPKEEMFGLTTQNSPSRSLGGQQYSRRLRP